MTFDLGSSQRAARWDPETETPHLWVFGHDDRRLDETASSLTGMAIVNGWHVSDIDTRAPHFAQRLSEVQQEASRRLIHREDISPWLVTIRRLDLGGYRLLSDMDDMAGFAKHTGVHFVATAAPILQFTAQFDKLDDDGEILFTAFSRLVQTPEGFDLYEPGHGTAPVIIPRDE